MEPSFSEEDRRDARLEAIFRTHFADLYRYIYRQVHNAVIAEDLTSAVFLKALRWLQQNRSSESVKGWLYATARSIIADYWREHTQIHLLPLEEVEEMPMLTEERDEEMRAFNHNYIGTEHLLLGILREGSAAEELIKQGVTFEGMRGGIMFILGGRQEGTPGSQPGFTPRTQKVLVMAGEEAQRLGETAISPRHLLVAILCEGQGIAAQLLQVSGVRWEQVGETVHISVVPDIEEGPITLPTDFQEALQQHPAANTMFERLSYSKKKRFVDHIEQAEGEAARSQEVEKAIEQLQRIHQAHQG